MGGAFGWGRGRFWGYGRFCGLPRGYYPHGVQYSAAQEKGFAAGVLISVSFIHIIPRCFAMNRLSPLFLIFGFMGLYLFNRLLNIFVCQKRECPELVMGIVPMLGIGFHSFLDGVIYSVTFVLLERFGFRKRRASVYAFLAAGLSTPLGTLISYPLIEKIGNPALGLLLALSAGALVYVGASHLLPAVEKENRRYTLISLAAGILVAAGIVLSKQ